MLTVVAEMARNVYMLIFFLLMIACIVGVDVVFLRTHFVSRLIANILIVSRLIPFVL